MEALGNGVSYIPLPENPVADAKAAEEVGEGANLVYRAIRLKGRCFVAGTPVQMADSTTKPIQQVKTADKVWSRDPATGRTEIRRVVRTFKHLVHETLTVRLADRAGKVVETLTATPTHRFFVVGRGAVALGQLGIGTQIVTRAGPPLVIKSLVKHEYPWGIAVYNFEVQGDHTYFVGKAHGGTWVHNSCVKWKNDIPNFDPKRQASIYFGSKQEAYKYAGERIGANPLRGEAYGDPFKLRTTDQRLQFRFKPGDVAGDEIGPHIHIETLDRRGQVIRNLHVRWPGK